MAGSIRSSLTAAHTRLSRGSDRTRGVYRRARVVARAREFARRRDLAARLDCLGAFEIPEDDGYLVVAPGACAAVEPVLTAARALRQEVDTEPLWVRSQGRNLLRIPIAPRLDRTSAWLALALDPVVLTTVSRYLGTVPLLRGMQMWVSPYAERAPDGRRLEHRYHCDWADVRQVRVLVFVEDVTPEHGPLTLISARRSEEVRRASRYTFGEESCTIMDERLFAHVDPLEERRLTGPAGTLAFADTCRCFHQGSRVLRPGLERRMVMFQYLTITGFKLPAAFADDSPFAHFASDDHSELQRMVLGARSAR